MAIVPVLAVKALSSSRSWVKISFFFFYLWACGGKMSSSGNRTLSTTTSNLALSTLVHSSYETYRWNLLILSSIMDPCVINLSAYVTLPNTVLGEVNADQR